MFALEERLNAGTSYIIQLLQYPENTEMILSKSAQLLANPNLDLVGMDKVVFAPLQQSLMDEDESIRNQTYVFICKTILESDVYGKKIFQELWPSSITLNDEDLARLSDRCWQALASFIYIQRKEFVLEFPKQKLEYPHLLKWLHQYHPYLHTVKLKYCQEFTPDILEIIQLVGNNVFNLSVSHIDATSMSVDAFKTFITAFGRLKELQLWGFSTLSSAQRNVLYDFIKNSSLENIRLHEIIDTVISTTEFQQLWDTINATAIKEVAIVYKEPLHGTDSYYQILLSALQNNYCLSKIEGLAFKLDSFFSYPTTPKLNHILSRNSGINNIIRRANTLMFDNFKPLNRAEHDELEFVLTELPKLIKSIGDSDSASKKITELRELLSKLRIDFFMYQYMQDRGSYPASSQRDIFLTTLAAMSDKVAIHPLAFEPTDQLSWDIHLANAAELKSIPALDPIERKTILQYLLLAHIKDNLPGKVSRANQYSLSFLYRTNTMSNTLLAVYGIDIQNYANAATQESVDNLWQQVTQLSILPTTSSVCIDRCFQIIDTYQPSNHAPRMQWL